MKKCITFFVILVILQLCLPVFSYADYLQLPDGSFEPVLMALFDNEKYLVYADKKLTDRAITEGTAVMIRSGTRCVEIEQEIKRIMFVNRSVSKIILVEGDYRGSAGWVLSSNLKYENNVSSYFESGDTVVMMKNGKVIRGNLGKMSQAGISLNFFDSASDVLLKRENILQIESTDKGFGYL